MYYTYAHIFYLSISRFTTYLLRQNALIFKSKGGSWFSKDLLIATRSLGLCLKAQEDFHTSTHFKSELSFNARFGSKMNRLFKVSPWMCQSVCYD